MAEKKSETEQREHISSPEELHRYLRVTSPRMWMLLSAFLVLLAGFIVYASTAKLENTMPVRVEIRSGKADDLTVSTDEDRSKKYGICVLPSDMEEKVSSGMTVRIGDEKGRVSMIAVEEEKKEISLIIDFDKDTGRMIEGVYEAELVLESVTPMSFLWN